MAVVARTGTQQLPLLLQTRIEQTLLGQVQILLAETQRLR